MSKFTDELDTIGMISKPARNDLGEDNFFCDASRNSALVSVFDGCGGLGARKYDSFMGHTGAYIASRAASGAVRDWYQKHADEQIQNGKMLVNAMYEYINEAFSVCGTYAVDRLKISGSMVRKFPTTMAMAYAVQSQGGIKLHVLWAGDSRVYLLDEDGLAQLTLDDTDERDAFVNLTSDSPMTNVLSGDGNYRINYKTVFLNKPALVFAATDGCFGYIPSPMEFEYEILSCLMEEKTPRGFWNSLEKTLAEYAGDDLALGYMSFGFGDFKNMKRLLGARLRDLTDLYISEIQEANSDSCREALWGKYRPGYERLMD